MMTTFRQFLANEMNNVKYNFSSTQVMLPKTLAQDIIAWGKEHISDNIIFQDPADSSFGREDEIHVTVLYGLHLSDPKRIKKFLEKEGQFEVTLGKTSLFTTNPKFDVLKLEVRSPGLHHMNKILSEKFKTTNSYPIYKPHITIAYIKKDQAKKLVGDKAFDKQTFDAQEIVFSSHEGTKTKIPLVRNHE